MESIFEVINEWLTELLIGAINGNLSNMFRDANDKDLSQHDMGVIPYPKGTPLPDRKHFCR